jgi:antirestriction protein ArdC
MEVPLHRDLYQEVTSRIVAALETGVTPWIQPWTADFEPTPLNAVSRRCYRGINTVLLTLEAQARGFSRNAWLTYRQARELGAYVRPGETGCVVVFYKLHELPHTATVEQIEDDAKPKVVPLLRSFTVFNLAQVENLPERLRVREAMVTWQPDEAAERLLAESRAVLHHGGAFAYYDPRADHIQLPERKCFDDAAGYYGTALHELCHWTGHASRLNRNLGRRFGDAAYAAEELIAEIGSAFLCSSCYLEGRLRHASYIANWLTLLRNDKRAIFAAAAKAQQAVDFIESVCGTPPIAISANMDSRNQEAGAA